jgi:hypothetical protein
MVLFLWIGCLLFQIRILIGAGESTILFIKHQGLRCSPAAAPLGLLQPVEILGLGERYLEVRLSACLPLSLL